MARLMAGLAWVARTPRLCWNCGAAIGKRERCQVCGVVQDPE